MPPNHRAFCTPFLFARPRCSWAASRRAGSPGDTIRLLADDMSIDCDSDSYSVQQVPVHVRLPSSARAVFGRVAHVGRSFGRSWPHGGQSKNSDNDLKVNILVTRLATAVSSRKTPKMAINRNFPGLRAFSANVARDKNEEQEIPHPMVKSTARFGAPKSGLLSESAVFALWTYASSVVGGF